VGFLSSAMSKFGRGVVVLKDQVTCKKRGRVPLSESDKIGRVLVALASPASIGSQSGRHVCRLMYGIFVNVTCGCEGCCNAKWKGSRFRSLPRINSKHVYVARHIL
jgi:hypothetical protein